MSEKNISFGSQFEGVLLDFSSKLSKVPELGKALVWIKENPEEAGSLVKLYISLLRKMENYSVLDRSLIERARDLMIERNVTLKSASTLNTADLLKNLTKNNSFLTDSFLEVFDTNSDVYTSTINGLAEMMRKGSDIAINATKKPTDGDYVWDEVIWGHTQARDDAPPVVLAHFTFAHFISQFMNREYGEMLNLKEKDDFINVLSDLILLEYASGDLPANLFDIWAKSKTDCGLGWITKEQLEIYKEVLQEGKPIPQ